MSAAERPTEPGRGQEPGADVGYDGDVPKHPLLPEAVDDEPAEAGREGIESEERR